MELKKYFLRRLMNLVSPRWGAAHTEERNIFKGLPKHIIGKKETKNQLEELYKMGFIKKYKKTNEIHISLAIDKKNK
jgi:hypothetical protein